SHFFTEIKGFLPSSLPFLIQTRVNYHGSSQLYYRYVLNGEADNNRVMKNEGVHTNGNNT
ncbi:hypothetical protein, partial [Blautia sp. HCP3S3_B11]